MLHTTPSTSKGIRHRKLAPFLDDDDHLEEEIRPAATMMRDPLLVVHPMEALLAMQGSQL